MVDKVGAKIGKYMVKMAEPRRAKKRRREERSKENVEKIYPEIACACERLWEMILYQGKSGDLP